jgi:hypothetical protein
LQTTRTPEISSATSCLPNLLAIPFPELFIVRFLTFAFLLFCAVVSSSGQAQPATGTQATSETANAKPASKKQPPKAKAVAKPPSAESGYCQLGVIPAIDDRFTVQHIGLTVFGNEFTEAQIESWGLDDLVVARVRATAGGSTVWRIAYSKDAFAPYYHPPEQLFRDASNDLTDVVRQIVANASCARYVVVTRSGGQVGGTNQTASGIGLLTNWSSGAFKKGALFAFIRITVFDGQSFAKYDPSVGERLAAHFSNLLKDDNFRTLDDFEAPTTPEAAASNIRLRDGARALLAANWTKLCLCILTKSPNRSDQRPTVEPGTARHITCPEHQA